MGSSLPSDGALTALQRHSTPNEQRHPQPATVDRRLQPRRGQGPTGLFWLLAPSCPATSPRKGLLNTRTAQRCLARGGRARVVQKEGVGQDSRPGILDTKSRMAVRDVHAPRERTGEREAAVWHFKPDKGTRRLDRCDSGTRGLGQVAALRPGGREDTFGKPLDWSLWMEPPSSNLHANAISYFMIQAADGDAVSVCSGPEERGSD